MSRGSGDQQCVSAIVVTARQLAIMLQVSKRTLWRMSSAGRLPRPMRVGGVVRWKLETIVEWINDGCPIPGQERRAAGVGGDAHVD